MDSWEAITSTAKNSDANSTISIDAHNDDDANGLAELSTPRSEVAAAINAEERWFGMGGLGLAALSLAQGVASAIHQTAVNVAEELAELERLAGQELEEEEEEEARRRHEGTSSSTRCDDDNDDGGDAVATTSACTTFRRSEDTKKKLPLPWQVPSTHHCKTARAKTGDDDNGLSLVEDEQLKATIMALALSETTFKGPFTVENTSTTTKRSTNDDEIGDNEDDDDDEAKLYFTKERVELIERILGIDQNLAKAHAALCASSSIDELVFFKNYFFCCDEVRANYTIRDEELDIDIVLQTPPPSPQQRDRPLIPAMPSPRQLSVDDLVLVGIESENNRENSLSSI